MSAAIRLSVSGELENYFKLEPTADCPFARPAGAGFPVALGHSVRHARPPSALCQTRQTTLDYPDPKPRFSGPTTGGRRWKSNTTTLRKIIIDRFHAIWQVNFLMTENKPPSPGEFIKTELQRRGWTQTDFALVVGRHIPIVNEILQGKRPITPELAVAIGTALGTGPQIWLERESAYRLSLLEPDDSQVERRARLFELAPVKEMEKRGWIRPTKTIEEIEQELRAFFNRDSLEADHAPQALARQTNRTDEFTAAQRAWLRQAHRLASLLNVRPFRPETFKAGLPQVRALAESAEKARHVPKVLAELGVRFVVVEPLPRSRIDGAAFWLDDDPTAPVIVLSLRYDRIDWFWHTLAHEAIHIKHGDPRSVDVNLVGESRVNTLGEIEERADKEGASLLIPPDSLQSFTIRMRPFYYKERIREFANRMRIHPGIVNGQLQHAKEVGWDHNREMLVKVREIVTSTALTDGWGKSAEHLFNKKPEGNN